MSNVPTYIYMVQIDTPTQQVLIELVMGLKEKITPLLSLTSTPPIERLPGQVSYLIALLFIFAAEAATEE
jgi:hypothetical protein